MEEYGGIKNGAPNVCNTPSTSNTTVRTPTFKGYELEL